MSDLTADAIIPRLLFMRARTNTVQYVRKNELRSRLQLWRVVCVTNRPDPDWENMAVKYDHWPMSDSLREIPKTLAQRVALVVKDVEDGLPVLVYCESGRNRSGLFCALVVRQHFGMTGQEAVALVKYARPGALRNPFFVKFLEGLGRYGR